MKNKKILVTGSSGFIGSHVADALEQNGYNVILFDIIESKYKTNTQKDMFFCNIVFGLRTNNFSISWNILV